MNIKAMIALAVFLGIAGLVLALSVFFQSRIIADFRARGIEATATVAELDSKRVIRRVATNEHRRRNKYFAKLSFFTQVSSKDTAQNRKIIEKDSLGNYRINLKVTDAEIGDFIQTEIRISSKRYQNLTKGQKVQIQYLPENPQKVMFKDDLE